MDLTPDKRDPKDDDGEGAALPLEGTPARDAGEEPLDLKSVEDQAIELPAADEPPLSDDGFTLEPPRRERPPSSMDHIPESLRSVVGTQVAIKERDEMASSAFAARVDRGEFETPQMTLRIGGAPEEARPSYLFFGIVAALSLAADITTKVWAELVINQRGFEPIKIIGENVSVTLAYNQGGAWGLFSTADEMIRKPFFVGVSCLAVFFIISLYSRLHSTQTALKWGLPLVLGGALGNLSDRITRSQVIDFIDYRADWVLSMNSFIRQYVSGWTLTDHWPTFNVADVAICIGVVLMGVDMFTHRPGAHSVRKTVPPSGPSKPPGEDDALESTPPAETAASESVAPPVAS